MAVTSRFAVISKEDRAKLLHDAAPKSTRDATASWIRIFENFGKSEKIVCDLESVDKDSLADVLEKFYCSVRKKDGGEYKRSGYIAARSAASGNLMVLVEG